MKFPSMLAASGLMLAGMMIQTSVLAAGLPVAGYRPLKLPAYTTHDGAVNYTIRLESGQIDGVVLSVDGKTLMVVAADEAGEDITYTVDTALAKVLNAVGAKAKAEDIQEGDRVVVDGYFANRSTGMSARRVIDVGLALRP